MLYFPKFVNGTYDCSVEHHKTRLQEETFSEEENLENQRKDEGVQTPRVVTNSNRENRGSSRENRNRNRDSIGTNRENRGTNTDSCIDHGFGNNFPFGYILIHDNYDSRIPTKIIFTSINSDVSQLI